MRFTPHLLALTLLVTTPVWCTRQAQSQVAPGNIAASQVAPINAQTQTGTASITGRVVAADTGEPIPQAAVNVTMPQGPPDWNVVAFTDKDGRYALTWLPAGTMSVYVRAPGFARQTYQHPDDPNPATNTLIPLADAATVDSIDFRLEAAGKIHGVILDQNGQPIPKILVNAYQQASDTTTFQPYTTAFTDKDGHFELYAAPGVYRIEAGGANNVTTNPTATYRRTWLGNSATPDNSQTIEVHANTDTTDLRILLPPTTPYKLTVTPVWPKSAGPEPELYSVTLTGGASISVTFDPANPPAKFFDLPADKYHITATAYKDSKLVARGTADTEITTSDITLKVPLTPIPNP